MRIESNLFEGSGATQLGVLGDVTGLSGAFWWLLGVLLGLFRVAEEV